MPSLIRSTSWYRPLITASAQEPPQVGTSAARPGPADEAAHLTGLASSMTGCEGDGIFGMTAA